MFNTGIRDFLRFIRIAVSIARTRRINFARYSDRVRNFVVFGLVRLDLALDQPLLHKEIQKHDRLVIFRYLVRVV